MAWTLAELEAQLLIGSTLVEGSTLSEAEARDVLAGRTISGHSAREHRELLNHRAAVEWLMRELTASPYVSVDIVLGFHRRLMEGIADDAGSWKAFSNYTFRSNGTRHDYAAPAAVAEAMAEWVRALDDARAAEPAVAAAEIYSRFQQIHPFEDGNGRVGRIFVAYFLHWKHAMRFRFFAADKAEHLHAIQTTDDGDIEPLVAFFRARIDPEPA